MRRAAILLGVPAVLAALVAVPLGLVRGPHHWLCAAVAVALTVTPGIVTLVAADRMAKASPYGRVAALVLGTVVRLAVGFGGGVAVFFAAGDTFRAAPLVFWGWVLGAYLVTLIVETVLLGRSQELGAREQRTEAREQTDSPIS
jgi:hypothetical protein